MAEAKKMMDNPAYQKKMKEMQNSKEFKDNMKQTVDMLKDPAKAAHAEAKFEHMVKVGEDQIKSNSKNVMEDAMASMANPEVMREMTNMLKDPSTMAELQKMLNDPSSPLKNYMAAMEDMMSDPQKKKQMEMIAEAMKSQM
jgi:hypothetical protein